MRKNRNLRHLTGPRVPMFMYDTAARGAPPPRSRRACHTAHVGVRHTRPSRSRASAGCGFRSRPLEELGARVRELLADHANDANHGKLRRNERGQT